MNRDKKTGRWHYVFDSREAAVALDFYTRLCTEKWIDAKGQPQRGYICPKQAGRQVWNLGKTAMMFFYVEEQILGPLEPAVEGIVPVPLGPTGKRGAEFNGRTMGLSSRIKHPAVRDAAWEYIRFHDSPEAMEVRLRVLANEGFGPYISPKYLRRLGDPKLLSLVRKDWWSVVDTAIETGVPEMHGPDAPLAYAYMTYPIRAARKLALADKLPEDREKRLAVLQALLRKVAAHANARLQRLEAR